jgi:hypothetical protein
MALLPAPRTGLTQYTAGSDPHPGRVKFNEQVALLDSIVALGFQGTPAARPAAGKAARFFWDENAKRLAWDDGTAWQDLNPNGGGGPGAALAIGGAGVEGTSSRSARADHTHPLPLASSTVNGAMVAADKAKLDAATDAVINNTLVRRDGNGRFFTNTPTLPGHASPKSYVDGLINDTATYVDNSIADRMVVCTSTTRPAHKAGKRIYETDTSITRYSDGTKWQALHMPYKQYTPQWQGWQNLGGGYISGGEWSIIGPDTVRASMVMVAGSGASMGNGRLAVTLPTLVAATGVVQFGDGAHIRGSVIGPQSKFIVATGDGAGACEIWHAPMMGNYRAYETLGTVGYPWGQGDNMHVQITYKAALAI